MASHVITASVVASSAKKIAVGNVQAIHAMLSMTSVSSDPAERETARDVVADKPDHQRAWNKGQDACGRQQSPIHPGGGNGARHYRRDRLCGDRGERARQQQLDPGKHETEKRG